ncbi:MAG: hypothetical protein AB1491_01815 [Thermodesulfobacteriota bacterium]
MNLEKNAGPLIGIIVVIGGFIMMWFRPEAKVEALMMAVVAYYFGSSVGSRIKDEAFKIMARVNGKREEPCEPEKPVG